MKLIQLSTLFLLLFCQNALSQVVEGHVVDKQTGEPLSYVNIGVVELGIGTVSTENGTFKLTIQKGKADSILFSAIGYESMKYALSELEVKPEVALMPKRYEIEAIDITKKAKGKDKIYGKKIRRPGGSTTLSGNKPGDEIAAHIKIRKKTYLKSANFIINQTSGDSMLYRVNIYDFSDEKLGENILIENIFLGGAQKQGTVSVDLTPYQIVIDHDVLLALENINVDSDSAGLGPLFRFASRWFVRNTGVYMRYGEESKNVQGDFTKELGKTKLCFYFVGRRVE